MFFVNILFYTFNVLFISHLPETSFFSGLFSECARFESLLWPCLSWQTFRGFNQSFYVCESQGGSRHI